MDESSSCSSMEMEQIPKLDGSEGLPNPDRLSELPDSVLLRIISRLPIEDAVRTGALSTMWKNKWKNVDEITIPSFADMMRWDGLPHDESYKIRIQELAEGINRTLFQFACPNIKRISLSLWTNRFLPTKVIDERIQWAFSRNAKVLVLEFENFHYYAFECYNSSLEKMCISGLMRIEFVDHVVNWTSLKSLSLSWVWISDEDISKVLSGCPLLEILDLEEVSSIAKLNIVNPRLKTLRIVSIFEGNDRLSEVNAPCLEYIEIGGLFCDVALRLTNVTSLHKASLDLSYDFHINKVDLYVSQSTALLEGVSNVEELVLGEYHIQALSTMELLGKPCSLFRCRHLAISLYAFKHEFPGISYLFQRSPYVETLVINVSRQHVSCSMKEQLKNYIQGMCDDGATYLSRQTVDFQHLKNVKISHTFYLCSHRQSFWHEKERIDVELATYIVRNSHFLEKLVISSQKRRKCRLCSGKCSLEYFSLLSQKFFSSFSDRFEDGKWEVTIKESSCEMVFSKCMSAS